MRRAWLAILGLTLAWGPARRAAAQAVGAAAPDATPRPPVGTTATVRGVVFDSLVTGRPLAGAEVWVEGSATTTRTDAQGRWALAGVAAGRLRIAASHPALEAAGAGEVAREIVVPATGTLEVLLATPSAQAVQRRLCGRSLAAGEAVLVGVVRAADGAPPGAPASVTVEWRELGAAGGRIEASDVRAATRTEGDGRFVVCGAPTEQTLLARAVGADGAVAVHPTRAGARGVGALTLALPASPDAEGMLRGAVRTEGGLPVAGATVETPDAEARTDGAGRFAVRLIGADSATEVRVRAVGFAPLVTTVPAGARGAALHAVLAGDAPTLPTVRTSVAANDFGGFEARRAAGLSGAQFVTADELRRRNQPRISQALMSLKGVRVQSTGGLVESFVVSSHRQEGSSPLRPRGCQMNVFVDGALASLATARGIDDVVDAKEVRGMEVYLGLAPIPETMRGADAGCGTILVWTTRGARP